MRLVFAIAAVALCLAGCNTTSATLGLASTAATVAAAANGPIPNQATDLGDALQIATLVTKSTQTIIDNVKVSPAALAKLNADSDALHAALGVLETANTNKQALDFSAFNAALAAYNTYTAELPAK